VSKRYAGRERAALDNVSISIVSGSVTAIIGPTGSGKSTLIDLVSGLVAPDDGAVRVDSVSLDRLDLDHWQSRIGIVPQDAPMVYGTVAENIAWLGGDRQRTRSMADVVEAAQLTELLLELPHGLETLVGSRGASLSGGQRQRIAIARALYREPRLLILDEATSALDPVTERLLLDAVLRLDPETAVLFITHRTETAMRADWVVVIDEGRAIAQGTPDEIRLSADPVVLGLLNKPAGQSTAAVEPADS
jgi:ATP-binding cassette subfamily B protein